MSLWTRISDAIGALASGEGLSAVFDRLRTPPDRSVAFTIAVIALGAKMAKADGQVTRDEVTAFREVFHIPPSEEPNAARVFNLARQDINQRPVKANQRFCRIASRAGGLLAKGLGQMIKARVQPNHS